MAAKVIWYRDAWWIRTRFSGRKKEKRFGPTKTDKAAALKTAERINAKIALGEYDPNKRTRQPIPFDDHLRTWHLASFL